MTQMDRMREEHERIMKILDEGLKEMRLLNRKILVTLGFLALLFIAPCGWGVYYQSLPRVCDVRIANVTEVISNRHCSMGCRGYDHLVKFTGIKGVTEQYQRDGDRVWRVAGPGNRIRVRVCTVNGHESSPPEIKILGRAP